MLTGRLAEALLSTLFFASRAAIRSVAMLFFGSGFFVMVGAGSSATGSMFSSLGAIVAPFDGDSTKDTTIEAALWLGPLMRI
jgi:hypothetical protein